MVFRPLLHILSRFLCVWCSGELQNFDATRGSSPCPRQDDPIRGQYPLTFGTIFFISARQALDRRSYMTRTAIRAYRQRTMPNHCCRPRRPGLSEFQAPLGFHCPGNRIAPTCEKNPDDFRQLATVFRKLRWIIQHTLASDKCQSLLCDPLNWLNCKND